ncbi:YaaC family protein [Bacillus sp. 2205SS5-2]|uniref:YaaC family protein n=1 Tax=Bacillus sp. 2205SS5-2 TaxID=3109031 RepID=UPI00300540D1
MLYHSQAWRFLHKFQSASSTQKFLQRVYQKKGIHSFEIKSYDNAYPFMYYLEHGEMYYQQAANSPLAIQPVLLFYGYTHLLKAGLLTQDSEYPQTASVLAHGVSTRKRKKQQYQFLEDEVKIQKNGLFSHIAEKLFQHTGLEGEKYTMKQLLTQIPEIQDLFHFHFHEFPLVALLQDKERLVISPSLLEQYHMSSTRFQEYITSKTKEPITIVEDSFEWTKLPTLFEAPPFRYHFEKNQYFLPSNKERMCCLPEMLLHYLLLYNLSMIARYETEWWSELLKTTPNEDYSFIKSFIMHSFVKTPQYIERYLFTLNT